MNAEITIVQNRFLKLYREHHAYLAGTPTQFLNDLQHEAGELRRHDVFSVRVGAEVNHAAATMILEQRGRNENHLARLRELQRRYSACEESNNEDGCARIQELIDNENARWIACGGQ